MIIDAAVHPVLADRELRPLIGQPWAGTGLPHPLGVRYAPPGDGFVVPPDDAGNPAAAAAKLFGDCGVSAAILSPLTRGLRPNPQEMAAIARGTNEWVADRWLTERHPDGVFLGSIRLPVTDVAASLKELDRWGDDPRFVQVAVPLRAYLPYGDEFYFPIWQAATERNLPVLVVDDLATGVAHNETPVGPPRFFTEKHVLTPMTDVVQFASLITSGVFDRLPELRFIFADCGVDLARFMVWKIEKDWRMGRVEIPWVEKLPGLYLPDHVRFLSQPEDGTPDGWTLNQDLIEISDAAGLAMFGSRFPFWNFADPRTALSGWPDETAQRILGQNALDFLPRLRAALPDHTDSTRT